MSPPIEDHGDAAFRTDQLQQESMRTTTKGILRWSYRVNGRLMDYSHRWVAIDH